MARVTNNDEEAYAVKAGMNASIISERWRAASSAGVPLNLRKDTAGDLLP